MKATILSILIFTLTWIPAWAGQNTVKLTSAEYPPYYGENLKDNGPVTEIVVAAYKKANYDIEVSFFPWVRAEDQAKKGNYDGIFPPWHTKDRENYFIYSDPIFPNELGFYKKSGKDIKYTSFSDLKPYRIGIVRGYANPKGFDEAGLKTDAAPSDLVNLRKLHKGRTDLILIDKQMGQYLIKTELPEAMGKLEWVEPAVESEMQYLCISKKTANAKEKVEAFNKGLKLIRESGEYDAILKKHGF